MSSAGHAANRTDSPDVIPTPADGRAPVPLGGDGVLAGEAGGQHQCARTRLRRAGAREPIPATAPGREPRPAPKLPDDPHRIQAGSTRAVIPAAAQAGSAASQGDEARQVSAHRPAVRQRELAQMNPCRSSSPPGTGMAEIAVRRPSTVSATVKVHAGMQQGVVCMTPIGEAPTHRRPPRMATPLGKRSTASTRPAGTVPGGTRRGWRANRPTRP